MTARDSRGRFQNADVAAAERVLEAAVREAVAILRATGGVPASCEIAVTGRILAEDTLAHAAHAVEPLLRSAS